jgi:GNAT superfamily N-acetyltransferase
MRSSSDLRVMTDVQRSRGTLTSRFGCSIRRLQDMTTIREARLDDAEAAIDVVRRSIEELCVADHRNDPDTLAAWLANKTPRSFQDWIANPEHFCVVAVRENRVCGLGLLHRKGELMLFYLSPGTQRRGVGRLLYQALEQRAVQWRLGRLHLYSTFMARSFYEAQGFRAAGPQKTVFGVLQSYPYEKFLQADASQPAAAPGA